MAMVATRVPDASKTGAARALAPSMISLGATAQPCFATLATSRFSASGFTIVFGVSVIVLIVGLAGMIARLISGVAASASRPRTSKASLAAPSPFDTAVSVPAEPVNTRASLKFDAESMAANDIVIPATAVEAVPSAGAQIAEPPSMEISTVEIRSLEPAIFSDNASDSFLTRQPEAAAEKPAPDASSFDANAALSETHGLQITSAQVIPIRPDVKIEDVKVETVAEAVDAPHDPEELADGLRGEE